MRCPDIAAFRLSPPFVARPLTCLTICSGKSHPDLLAQPQPVRHRFESHRSRAIRPPDRHRRVRAARDSPSNVATCHRPVHQQEPILQSYPAVDATDTRASRAWVHVSQPAPKTALKASRKVLYRPEECLGSHGAGLGAKAVCRESPRFAMPYHYFAVLASHFRDHGATVEW